MSHDDAFAALQARKRAAEAAGPPKVTWRRVSADTGGGWSGLGPNRRLVFVRHSAVPGSFDYGDVEGQVRVVRGTASTVTLAQAAAAKLLNPPTPREGAPRAR